MQQVVRKSTRICCLVQFQSKGYTVQGLKVKITTDNKFKFSVTKLKIFLDFRVNKTEIMSYSKTYFLLATYVIVAMSMTNPVTADATDTSISQDANIPDPDPGSYEYNGDMSDGDVTDEPVIDATEKPIIQVPNTHPTTTQISTIATMLARITKLESTVNDLIAFKKATISEITSKLIAFQNVPSYPS